MYKINNTVYPIDVISEFTLQPVDNKKSFYGKCRVLETEKWYFLLSYETIVFGYCKVNHCFIKIWDDWSVTTGRHIDAFTRNMAKTERGILGKKKYMKLRTTNIFRETGKYGHNYNYYVYSLDYERNFYSLQDLENMK